MVEVLQPGFATSIQDTGREGFQDIGVPVSGCMDVISAQLANRLLNNDDDDALLEITLQGPVLKFHKQTQICITGVPVEIYRNEKELLQQYQVIWISEGDVISIKNLKAGVFGYIAIKGGWQTSSYLNSRSWYAGISLNPTLKKGDQLSYFPSSDPTKLVASSLKPPKHLQLNSLTVYPGPEYELLSKTEQVALLETIHVVSKNTNRMAYKLATLVENTLPQIITSIVQPGTIQLTPSGKLIVLMRDAQTTGGYPRILQLSEYAIACLSQKRMGDAIQFYLEK